MSDKHRYHLLRAIEKRYDVSQLVTQGVEYSQIASMIIGLIEDGLVSVGEEDLTLTETGFQEYKNLEKRSFDIPKQGWIVEDTRFRIERLGKDDIYLPARKKK